MQLVQIYFKMLNTIIIITTFLACFLLLLLKISLMDPHIECGSRRENVCESIRIRIHCPGSGKKMLIPSRSGTLNFLRKIVVITQGKTPEEIRKTFNIKNDFTPSEEEQVTHIFFFFYFLKRDLNRGPLTQKSVSLPMSNHIYLYMICRFAEVQRSTDSF